LVVPASLAPVLELAKPAEPPPADPKVTTPDEAAKEATETLEKPRLRFRLPWKSRDEGEAKPAEAAPEEPKDE